MWQTLMFLISSGGKSPNWISCTVFSGAELYGKLKFDMMPGMFRGDVAKCVFLSLSTQLLLS